MKIAHLHFNDSASRNNPIHSGLYLNKLWPQYTIIDHKNWARPLEPILLVDTEMCYKGKEIFDSLLYH